MKTLPQRASAVVAVVVSVAAIVPAQTTSASDFSDSGRSREFARESDWWTNVELLSFADSSFCTKPTIACDLQGGTHVAWVNLECRWAGGEWIIHTYIFYRAKPSGEPWGPEEVVSTESDPTRTLDNPSLAVDALGNVHIAWDDATDYAGAGPDRDILYKMKPYGGLWGQTQVVSVGSDSDSYEPCLVADADGLLHVAWTEEHPVEQDVAYVAKPTSDTSWPPFEFVAETDLRSYGPSLIVTADRTVHVAWSEGLSWHEEDWSALYARKGLGTPWSPPEVAADGGPAESFFPTLASKPDQTVVIAWLDRNPNPEVGDDDGAADVYYRERIGEAWSPVELVSRGTDANAYAPAVVSVDEASTIHIVWRDYTTIPEDLDLYSDIFYAQKPSGAMMWGTVELVSWESLGEAWEPGMAIDPDGRLHVAWQDYSDLFPESESGLPDVFYKMRWSDPSGVDPQGPHSQAGQLELLAAYPNPSGAGGALGGRAGTIIAFRLTASSTVSAAIFDAAGRAVRSIPGGQFGPGRHEISWDGRDGCGHLVAAGAYCYRLRWAEGTRSGKVVLVP